MPFFFLPQYSILFFIIWDILSFIRKASHCPSLNIRKSDLKREENPRFAASATTWIRRLPKLWKKRKATALDHGNSVTLHAVVHDAENSTTTGRVDIVFCPFLQIVIATLNPEYSWNFIIYKNIKLKKEKQFGGKWNEKANRSWRQF